VKHIGLASVRGRRREATTHLKAVNDWSDRKAGAYVRKAFHDWTERTRHEWAVEIDWDELATRYGAQLTRKGREKLSAGDRQKAKRRRQH